MNNRQPTHWLSTFTGLQEDTISDQHSIFSSEGNLDEEEWHQSPESMQVIGKHHDVTQLIEYAKQVANKLQTLVEKSEASYGMLSFNKFQRSHHNSLIVIRSFNRRQGANIFRITRKVEPSVVSPASC